ncbi:MAG TPA: diaminopimelate epimerase [Gemmatimonadales bacterium]
MRFGRTFYKLSGSGNDFVAFDGMAGGAGAEEPSPEAVRALCRRGVGIGADGVFVIRPVEGADYQLLYYNADGGRAALCGNASLCSVRLAAELGHFRGGEVRFMTDAGLTVGRLVDGMPEIDLAAPTEVSTDRIELLGAGAASHGSPARVGFARVGVPHVVILCSDAERVELERVAPPVRAHPSLADGANVNYVSRRPEGGWILRTFERGVEAETLACGTGSVATATLLSLWGELGASGGRGSLSSGVADGPVELVTRSGEVLRVRLRGAGGGMGAGRGLAPSLGGTARIVYRGELGEVSW